MFCMFHSNPLNTVLKQCTVMKTLAPTQNVSLPFCLSNALLLSTLHSNVIQHHRHQPCAEHYQQTQHLSLTFFKNRLKLIAVGQMSVLE